MKKQTYLSNSRLYVTEDIDREGVWFVRTDTDVIARLRLNGVWEVYIYPYKFNQRFNSLTESLNVIEYIFKKFWKEKYGDSKCDTQ